MSNAASPFRRTTSPWYVADTANYRVQRFAKDGYFAARRLRSVPAGCFVLGDFGFVTDVSVNSNFYYLLDRDRGAENACFETTPITDVDDQTMQQEQNAFVTYQSRNNFTGQDTFSFFANDGLEDSNEAIVTINVARNFRTPIATANLAFETDEDTTLTLQLSRPHPDEDRAGLPDRHPAETTAAWRASPASGRTNPIRTSMASHGFEFVATDAPTSVPALESEPGPRRVDHQSGQRPADGRTSKRCTPGR
ncbi:MAG: hypothetical protein U5K38_05650 [Woeseiaceae bacterium]|nr:hypothetical protein [Woeseiaceae bacterium]